MEGSDRRRAARVRLRERDLILLEFVAEHRLVLPDHVAALLERSRRTASARLRALAEAGYLRQERVFDRHPPSFLIARKGLGVIGSELPTPRMDLRGYTHDIGVAWLWLAARAGSFGALESIHGERRLRSRDAAADRAPGDHAPGDHGPDRPLGVRLGGVGPRGRERIHYPDLLLVTRDGRRIALELELSWKGRRRREDILTGYAFDNRVDAVVYLVEDPRLGRAIADSARRLGLSDRVVVQPVWVAVRAPGRGSTPPARVRARRPPESEATR